MNPVTLGFLVLAAVLVGAAVPVLFQLRATLRSAQTTLDELRPQVQRTLTAVEDAVVRLNRVSSDVEESAAQVKAIVASVAALGKNVSQFGASLHGAASWGSAIGPAFVAALRAFGGRRRSDSARPTQDGPTPPAIENAQKTPQEVRS